MIDIDTWPLKIEAIVFVGGFLVALGCLLGRLYIGLKYLERMLKAFGRSIEVRMWEARYSRGLFERVLLVAILANLLFFSDFHIKRGDVSAQDIQDFPRDLKRILVIDTILLWSSAIIFIVLGVLVDLRSGA